MQALVLESKLRLSLREIDIPEAPGPRDVAVRIHTVGICGSDVHYYTHGAIGSFVVHQPMVLGHEASGTVAAVGSAVTHLRPGDRVCMEPGIPDPHSHASRIGRYNLDPAVRFWATPPVHGCLRPAVVHPAEFTFKLPDNVSFGEGAMVEPLAVGMNAVGKAGVVAGDVAVVLGAGPIGLVTTLAALAAGCSQVVVSDIQPAKLKLAATLGPVTPVDGGREDLGPAVARATGGRGADIVFECSGSARAAARIFELLGPGGRLVFIGLFGAPLTLDLEQAHLREARMETVFRYAHEFPRALAMMGGRRIDVRPLITDRFAFSESVRAFEHAAAAAPGTVKAQIELSGADL